MPGTSVAPSTRSALAIFLIVGPLLYLPLLLALNGTVFFLHPVTWLLGAVFWVGSLLDPVMWLVTVIPTSTAAITFAFILRRMAKTGWYARASCTTIVMLGALASGLISALIYLCGYQLARLLKPGFMGQSDTSPELPDLHPIGVHIALLWNAVPLVAMIGALLGTWLTWRSYLQNKPQ